MLKQGMMMQEISDIMGTTMALVAATKERFDLPRAEEQEDPEGI